MRAASRRMVAVTFCVALLSGAFMMLPHAARRAAADGKSAAPILAGRVDGGLAAWQADAEAWRVVLSGEALEPGARVRVGHGGCAEALLDAGASRVVFGPGATATLENADSISLTHGAAAFVVPPSGGLGTSRGRKGAAFRVITASGDLELINGEAIAVCSGDGVIFSLLRGEAQLYCGKERTKRALEIGKPIEVTASGVRASEIPAATLAALAFKAETNGDAVSGMGRLVVRDSAGREADALEVRELRARAHIDGAVAQTEIEETFFNPTYTRAEGTFYFPIPAGASLSRFAMYVDGKLVEGELVERNRAREVYEEIVRHMQDPALMEWQEGNIFKTRIFPIPPHGPKRILISYTQLLPASNGERRYIFPLVSKATQASAIGSFEFEAEILNAQAAPRLAAFPDAQSWMDKSTGCVQLKRTAFRPAHDLVLHIDAPKREALELLADRRAAEDGFFLLSYSPFVVPPPGGTARRIPPKGGTTNETTNRDVILLFDTSLSRRADDYKAQLKVARTLLGELGEHDRFAAISFDVAPRVHQDRFVSGEAAKAKTMSELEAIVPLGATDVEAAFEAVEKFLDKNSHTSRDRKGAGTEARTFVDVILIGDGIATLGETAPEKLAAKICAMASARHARIHTVAMGAQHERLLLREIARKSGGLSRVIVPGDNVEAEAFRLALALESKLLPAPKFEFSGGAVCDVYPAQPETLVAGEELILTGRFETPVKTTVSVTRDGTTTSSSFDLPEKEGRHVYISRLWARERLDALMLAEQNAATVKQIVDLSQEFTLITPYTSFLVLENEDAYRRYGIDRHKRRQYWDDAGSLKSVPPPEEIQPVAPPRPRWIDNSIAKNDAADTPKPAEKAAEPPLTLGDLDLSLLWRRAGSGRETTTALSTMCFEVYYRYAQLSTDSGPPPATNVTPPELPRRAASRLEAGAPGNASAASEMPFIEVPPDILARAELGDHFETMNMNSAWGNPDASGWHYVPAGNENAVTGWYVNPAGGAGNNGKSLEDMVGAGGARSSGDGGGWGGGVGAGTGNDAGSGHGSFGNRNGGGRRLMVKRHGGSKATENTCDSGLNWLAYHQYADGHFGGNGIEETGLSLLAFLGAGHSEKVGEYKSNVKQAVSWLIAQQRENGQIGVTTFEHAVGTMALSEAAAMSNIPNTRDAAQRAINRLTEDLQDKHDGARHGWSNSPHWSDPLISVWAVLALKSAKVGGLHVNHAAFDGVIAYFDSITSSNGAVAGRLEAGGPASVDVLNTAGVALAHQMLGWRHEDAVVLGPAKMLASLVNHAQGYEDDLLLLRYFGTLLMFQQGGDDWKKWNEWVKKDLIAAQRRDGDYTGSWDPARLFKFGGAAPENPQEAAIQIYAALKAVAAAPRDAEALETFARALALCEDAAQLERIAGKDAGAPEARNLARLRLGMILFMQKKFDESIALFKAVYAENGRPENVLTIYADALAEAGRGMEALNLLIGEANEGRLSAWRRTMLATLLFEAKPEILDPAQTIETRLTGKAARDAELMIACARKARANNLRHIECAFYKRAYRFGARGFEVSVPYAESMRASLHGAEALAFLIKESLADDSRSLAVAARCAAPIAEMLLDEKCGERDPAGRIAKEFTGNAELRLAVFQRAVECAERSTDKNVGAARLVAELFEKMYLDCGRPSTLVQTYVGKLNAARRNADAARELERLIQAGYHTTWAFQTLADAYRKTGLGATEILRAVSSETEIFPRDVQPHINLGQFYEQNGQGEAALMQYREAVRLKPSDAYYYKQLVERAVAVGRFDVAGEMLEAMHARFPNQANVWGSDDGELRELLKKSGDAEGQRKIRSYFEQDLVVILSWDTSATDIDLHVIEPGGEECSYNHRQTASGGTLDHDVTSGFGPETYVIRRAKPGTYKIDVEYYGGSGAPTVATLKIFTNRNGAKEQLDTKTVNLGKVKERVTVGEWGK